MSPAARPALRLATPCAAPDGRSDLVRLCAGEPVALEAVDLIAFVNRPYAGLDPDIHPDQYTLAEIALERFHSHVGTFRRTKGDRAQGIASDMGRYILPFASRWGQGAGLPAARGQWCPAVAVELPGPGRAGRRRWDRRVGVDLHGATLAG
jgi:hypothetical protein